MKALITGITGFAGSHLADLLISQNISVYGFYHPDHETANIDHIKNKIGLIPANLLDAGQVNLKIKKLDLDYVFHLAASSSPSLSFRHPWDTFENNLKSQINLLEALNQIRSKAKILIIGSAEEYGLVSKEELPLDENARLRPPSPYAVSKIAQDFLGFEYFIHHKMQIVRVRPFNHIGPRQSPGFVVAAFASQIAQIEKARSGEIKVGNLNSYRDFTDVRDMARAYLLALEKGKAGDVYNIGSGKLVKISKVLELLISLSSAKIDVVIDKSRFAPVEIEAFSCNYSKFHKATGWKPTIPLETTLSDTINYERGVLNSKHEILLAEGNANAS